jgi:hypothetical protein
MGDAIRARLAVRRRRTRAGGDGHAVAPGCDDAPVPYD